jgi:tetratricopeptide (TPR) repeat protein
MTSTLERAINDVWASFSETYKKMGEARQSALDYVKDAIVGEIQPNKTENRISVLEESLEMVATQLSGSVRYYAAKMIDAYAAHVGKTAFKRKHPAKYEVLAKLSQRLGTIYVNGLKKEIREQKKENRGLNKENSSVARNSDRADGLCVLAFACYNTNPENALELYEKAVKVEPREFRKSVIYENIGGLHFNADRFARALEAYEHCSRTKRISAYLRYCKYMVKHRQAERPQGNPLEPASAQQDAAAHVVQPSAEPAPARARSPARRRQARQQIPEQIERVQPVAQSEMPGHNASPDDRALNTAQAAQPAPAVAPASSEAPQQPVYDAPHHVPSDGNTAPQAPDVAPQPAVPQRVRRPLG